MNKTFKKIIFQSTIGLVLIFALSRFVCPYLTYNWRECLNSPGCTCEGVTSDLSNYIVDSAGYFLNSHAAYLTFLNRVELAETKGININEFKIILNSAIENMEKSKAMYGSVKIASINTTYNQEMIDKLMKFDYDRFRIQYGLIEPIFERVKYLLINGDITGLDNTILSNIENILKQLYIIKTTVDKDLIPDVSILWRINQSYVEAHLFGQYLSQILKANL